MALYKAVYTEMAHLYPQDALVTIVSLTLGRMGGGAFLVPNKPRVAFHNSTTLSSVYGQKGYLDVFCRKALDQR